MRCFLLFSINFQEYRFPVHVASFNLGPEESMAKKFSYQRGLSLFYGLLLTSG